MTITNIFATAWSSAFNVSVKTPTLLVVDDDRTMRAVLMEVLQKSGYKVLMAQNSKEAINILNEHSKNIDAMILDRELPDINGMDLVIKIKRDASLSSIPIIMLTGTSEQKKIQEGIDAGVFYYLVKPVENELLNSVIGSALRERRQKLALISEINHQNAALKAMDNCHLSVRTIKEAEDAASLLASCFPKPEKVVVGLMELMVNALEHGNLGINYEEKNNLLSDNKWKEELNRRASLPENANKIVEVVYQHKNGNHLVQITDSGNGFDWKRYWHINPARATASHGRGIARARLMSFDRMEYNEKGNRVTVLVADNPATGSGYAW